MSLWERVKLWYVIRRDYVKYKLSEWAFDLRLKRAVKKYGGGPNIPPEVVRELLGEGEDPMLVLIVHTNRVCERLRLEAVDTRFFDRIRWLLGKELPTPENRIYGEALMNEVSTRTAETNLYKVVLRELIDNQDIAWHQIPHRFPDAGSYEEFQELCGM